MKFRAFTEYHLELNFPDYISVGKPSGRIFFTFYREKGVTPI